MYSVCAFVVHRLALKEFFFSCSASVVSSQYHSTNAPYSLKVVDCLWTMLTVSLNKTLEVLNIPNSHLSPYWALQSASLWYPSSRVQTRPKPSDFSWAKNILSTPSFGRAVKTFVPCRRFMACKRSLNVTWKSGIFGQNSSAISRPSSSTFHNWGLWWRHLAVQVGTT